MKNGILASIIIPIFNAEKYLNSCIDSVISQNEFDKYEVICINDGSTDESQKIIENYCSKYRNITLINKTRGGVSQARNEGLNRASGRYILFLDSDDVFLTNNLITIFRKMETEDIRTAKFNYSCFEHIENVSHVDNIDEYQTNTEVRFHSSNVWGMVLDGFVIQKYSIRFREDMKYGEDTLFMYYYSNYTENTMRLIIPAALYGYRQHLGSAMHQKDVTASQKHSEDLFKMCFEYQKNLECEWSQDTLIDTQLRVWQGTEGALFYAMKAYTTDKRELLNYLKKTGLYPYPIRWRMLKGHSNIISFLKQFILTLFPIEIYYLTACNIYKMASKISARLGMLK